MGAERSSIGSAPMSEPLLTVLAWSDRACLAELAPHEPVILADPEAVILVDTRLVTDTIRGFAVASSDGSVLGGPAGLLADIAAEAAGTQARAVLAAWNQGRDVDLDHDHELFAPLSSVRLRGETIVSEQDRIPLLAYGPPDAIGALKVVLGDHRRSVAALLALDRQRPGPARIVANEMLAASLYTEEFCNALTDLVESFDAWESDRDDPVPGVEFSLRLTPAAFRAVEDDIATLVVPRLREHWPEFAWSGLVDAFVIRYDADADPDPEFAELRLHHDLAQISASVRLNTGYEGGALEFPRQSWSNADLAVGEFVAWPALVTHPHRGAPVRRGRKYGLTIWFALPEC